MSKHIIGIILLVVLIFSIYIFSSTLPLSEERIASLFVEAKQLYSQGEYQQAIRVYERIIRAEPENVRAPLEAGHTYRYWGKYEDSEKMFLKAAALSPSDPWVYTELGKLYRNMARYDEAEMQFFKSIELDPSREENYSYGLGYLYLEQKRFDEAEAMFRKALVLDPVSDLALSGLGSLYREIGDYAESEAHFKKVFELYPLSEARLGLAWTYLRQERYAEAVTELMLFLEHIREKGEVYYALGHAYTGLGEHEKAHEAFSRAVELNPDNEVFQNALQKSEK